MTGVEAGHKAGLAEGERRGKAIEKKEIAKKMLDLKLPIEQIKQITGLSEDEIKKL